MCFGRNPPVYNFGIFSLDVYNHGQGIDWMNTMMWRFTEGNAQPEEIDMIWELSKQVSSTPSLSDICSTNI